MNTTKGDCPYRFVRGDGYWRLLPFVISCGGDIQFTALCWDSYMLGLQYGCDHVLPRGRRIPYWVYPRVRGLVWVQPRLAWGHRVTTLVTAECRVLPLECRVYRQCRVQLSSTGFYCPVWGLPLSAGFYGQVPDFTAECGVYHRVWGFMAERQVLPPSAGIT